MVIRNFEINGTEWVVVKLDNGTHAMPLVDWKKAYGYLHPERWEK